MKNRLRPAALLAALAADNEIQVKASGTAPQNSFALKKTVTADAQKLAVRKYLLKQNAELDDRIVDEALSEYTKFIEDWEELDASWEALDSTQGQLTVEGMATIDLEEANEWLEARGVNRQGSIQIVVMEEPPSLGSMKFDEAFGTGIDGAKFFLQNYTLFQRKIRDALVKKVGTLGFDVQLLEDRPVYKKFLTADGTLVGVRFNWYDADGAERVDPSHAAWEKVTVMPGDDANLSAIAPRKDCKNWKLRFRAISQ